MCCAPAGKRFVAVLEELPLTAETLRELFPVNLATLVEREHAGVAFDRPPRAGEAVGCEECAHHRRARGEAGAEPFARHTVGAFERAAGLVISDSERVQRIPLSF